jgi:Fic family protein
VDFFLRGVATQAKEALEGTNRILGLHSRSRDMLGTKRVPQGAWMLIDHLFVNPVVSVAQLAKQWDITYPSIQKGVDYLLKHGVLKEITGRERNRLYVAPELHNLLAGTREPRAIRRNGKAGSGT